MGEEKRRSPGVTIWLNELQYQKLRDVEEDFKEVFGRQLTHGEAIMAAALISKAFIAFFQLGSQVADLDKLDFNQLINVEYLEKAGAQAPINVLTRLGGQIEKVFIQLDALGFLRAKGREQLG